MIARDLCRRMSRLAGASILLTLSLTGAACAARGGVPRPFPGAPTPPAAAEDAPPVTVPPDSRVSPAPVVTTALTLRGIPYRNGGTDPSGFDCSGLVQWVYAQHGMTLPREVRDQYRVGSDIDADDVRPGDLVFFETVSRGASHVGIALGGGEFVHAPSSRGVVRVERYDGAYWSRRWVGARRVVEALAEADD